MNGENKFQKAPINSRDKHKINADNYCINMVKSNVPLRRVRLLWPGLEEPAPGSTSTIGSPESSSMVCPMTSRPSRFMLRSRGPVSLCTAPPCSKGPSPEMTAGTRLLRNSMFDNTVCPFHSGVKSIGHWHGILPYKLPVCFICPIYRQAGRRLQSPSPVTTYMQRLHIHSLSCLSVWTTDQKRCHLSGFLNLFVWNN